MDGPTIDIMDNWEMFPQGASVLDVGCGEGRNAIFLAQKGFIVDAFDISWTGLEKARKIAAAKETSVNFFREDLARFDFKKHYDIILCHGALHMCNKTVCNQFIERAQRHTASGGFHIFDVFTNRLPAAPDMAILTKSLFDVGELPMLYGGWELVYHREGIIEDKHQLRACERIIAKKIDI